MPIIHPNILGDYDSGPFPPSSITTMADVRCSDGFSYGPLSVVSSLCTRAHVCVGRLNHKWRELVNLISPEYADAPPRHQVLIESRLVKYWHHPQRNQQHLVGVEDLQVRPMHTVPVSSISAHVLVLVLVHEEEIANKCHGSAGAHEIDGCDTSSSSKGRRQRKERAWRKILRRRFSFFIKFLETSVQRTTDGHFEKTD